MNKFLRSSAFKLAFGYVHFGIAALILNAAPLWYAYYVTLQDARREGLRTDAQRLSEIFRRQGVSGLSTYIDNRVGMQIPGERFLLFADSSLRPMSGNLPGGPAAGPPGAGGGGRPGGRAGGN